MSEDSDDAFICRNDECENEVDTADEQCTECDEFELGECEICTEQATMSIGGHEYCDCCGPD